MKINIKRFSLVIAALNLLIAVMLLSMSWRFYHGWDNPGEVHPIQIKEIYKDEMLRVLHYWLMPVMACLTSLSGILLWKLGRSSH
jgi:hypothetical protein